MKYMVNEDGVAALRKMAYAIMDVSEEIKAHAGRIMDVSEASDLGPHVQSLADASESILLAICGASEPIKEIAETLIDVAEGYEEVLRNDRFRMGNDMTTARVASDLSDLSKRKPSETENKISDLTEKAGFQSQVSFIKEKNEHGEYEIKKVPHGQKGSIRPDHVSYDEGTNTWYVLEDKNYSIEKQGGRDNLISNICKQAESRIAVFGAEGANVKQTYIIDLQGHLKDKTGHHVTLKEANLIVEKIQKKLIEKGIDPRNIRIRTLFGDNTNSDVKIRW